MQGHGGFGEEEVCDGGGCGCCGKERMRELYWSVMRSRVTNEGIIKVTMHRSGIQACMEPSLFIILYGIISFDLSCSKE